MAGIVAVSLFKLSSGTVRTGIGAFEVGAFGVLWESSSNSTGAETLESCRSCTGSSGVVGVTGPVGLGSGGAVGSGGAKERGSAQLRRGYR